MEGEVVVDRKVLETVDVELDKDGEVEMEEEVDAISVLVDPKVKLRMGRPEIIVTVGVGPPYPTGPPMGPAPMPTAAGWTEGNHKRRSIIKIATVERTDAAFVGMPAYTPRL